MSDELRALRNLHDDGVASDEEFLVAINRLHLEKHSAKNRVDWVLAGMAIIVAVAGFVWITASPSPGPDRDYFAVDTVTVVDVWFVCQQFLDDRLAAPSTAVYPRFPTDSSALDDGKTFELVGYVDAQNSFGAMLRTHFSCRVNYESDGGWRLFDLAVEG